MSTVMLCDLPKIRIDQIFMRCIALWLNGGERGIDKLKPNEHDTVTYYGQCMSSTFNTIGGHHNRQCICVWHVSAVQDLE